jgi:hypothetical protein
MAYRANISGRAFIQKAESASSTFSISEFFVYLAAILALLFTIGKFHPGI